MSAWEGLLLDYHSGDEQFENLLEALALYAPGMGSPCLECLGITNAIQQVQNASTPGSDWT